MELKLLGRFSMVDKWNKLKFVYIDDKTSEKLYLHCGGVYPYFKTEFTVCLPKTATIASVESMIGLDCEIRAKLVSFNFKLQTGEHKQGKKLVLLDIKRFESN